MLCRSSASGTASVEATESEAPATPPSGAIPERHGDLLATLLEFEGHLSPLRIELHEISGEPFDLARQPPSSLVWRGPLRCGAEGGTRGDQLVRHVDHRQVLELLRTAVSGELCIRKR